MRLGDIPPSEETGRLMGEDGRFALEDGAAGPYLEKAALAAALKLLMVGEIELRRTNFGVSAFSVVSLELLADSTVDFSLETILIEVELRPRERLRS